MEYLIGILILVLVLIACLYGFVIYRRNMQKWLPGYIRGAIRGPSARVKSQRHIIFCFVDHFEPQWRSPTLEVERARVDRWIDDYPRQARQFVDANGIHPQHGFFYPEEEYRAEHIDKLVGLCAAGLGEIEVHLHHDNDTADAFASKLQNFVKILHEQHGAFPKWPGTDQPAWGFIHGNWALCNSLDDGSGCGVNNELPILSRLGCYCDMTLPSAPSSAQTRTVNSIYYAEDVPGQPRSHETGEPVRVGGSEVGDLMIVQGPIGINFRQRRFGIIPAVENADIAGHYPPTRDRVDLWIRQAIAVQGRPEWVFVKVHTHGAQENNMDTVLGGPCDEMYEYLSTRYNNGNSDVLHYVNAREMFNMIKAAEAGKSGDPSTYRDFLLDRPTYKPAAYGGLVD